MASSDHDLNSTRGKILRDAFERTARSCFRDLSLQEVQQCFPAVTDPAYVLELHTLLSKVLKGYRGFAEDEFMEVCKSAQVGQGLQQLDERCAEQGIVGSGSAALVQWKPMGLDPEHAARAERMKLKVAELQQLQELAVQAEHEREEMQEHTYALRAQAKQVISEIQKAPEGLSHVHQANAIWASSTPQTSEVAC